MTAQGLFYWNEKHGKSQPRIMDFTYQITAAKTVSPYPQGADSFTFFDAITQNQIDTYLGVASDFPASYFDATAMGTDAFGGIIRMSGQTPSGITPTSAQASQIVRMDAKVYSGAGFTTISERAAFGPTGMTASTLETACAISSTGNLAFKFVLTGLDALTAGMIAVRVYWISK